MIAAKHLAWLLWIAVVAILGASCAHTDQHNPTLQPLVDFVGGALYIGAEVLMFLP
tara:strand:+ start:4446 stop:4613 length:168 start_codon:yes stop_codon:yes gene_type:complete